ncbi:MAG TPA: DUF3025 domain-containing protein [Usitatibacter sp.]|nr:DUF3025 domain-containing protein [Usitatibacter sp.]
MDWTAARERLRAPIFAPLQPFLSRLPEDRWPTQAELTSLARGIRTADGRPLAFVAPAALEARASYEAAIAATGEVPTRTDNWHDLFNALCWMAWPLAKAAINAQHAAILGERGTEEARRRGPERDALTLFDEGGVVVASSDVALLGLIRDFEWKALFWERRVDVEARMKFFAFGHACLEQSLAPYIGMVAKTVFVPVDELFHALPVESQVARVDELLAGHFASRVRFASPKSMAPMPVLGVPGWHFAAQDEAFYDDKDHFRGSRPDPREAARPTGIIRP